MQYRSEIDGLRAIAVLLVLFSHASIAPFTGGFIGVDIFYVISGYLITSIIYTDLDSGKFEFRKFYERRVRRILPALLVVLLVCIPITWLVMLPNELVDFSRGSISALFFISNIYFMFRGGYFRHELEENFLLHTWSLSVEEQFYIFFPLAIVFLYRRVPNFVLILLSSGLLLSLSLAEWGYRSHPTGSFYATPMRVWELLAGACCALLLTKRKIPKNNVLGFTGLLLIAASAVLYDSKTPFPSLFTVVPVLGASLIILFAADRCIAGRVLTFRPLLVTGLISYSMYLWHQPVFAFARISELFYGGYIFLWFAVVYLLSWLSWKYIENTFRDRKSIRFSKVCLYLGAAIAIVMAYALGAIFTNGYLQRFQQADHKMVSIDPIEFGDYVRGAFRKYHLKEFDRSAQVTVQIIGDSYAKDVLNAILETEANNGLKIALSTYEIRPGCGNLHLKYDFSHLIPNGEGEVCKYHGWYDNQKLKSNLQVADIVLIASNWSLWEVPLLSESIENIQELTNANIIVIGRKNFGEIDVRKFLEIPYSERKNIRQPVKEESQVVNAEMKMTIPQSNLLDLQQLVCESDVECRVFTDEGELMSRDGGHLTQDGAKYVGRKIRDSLSLN